MTKKKELIFVGSSTHCTDGKCIHSSKWKWVYKEDFDKAMKRMDEIWKKNYKTTDGVWYVKK